MDKAYLILAEIHLVGGEIVTDVDVFRADDEDTACNFATNVFIKGGNGVVMYGTTAVVQEAMAVIKVRNLGVIDLAHPENKAHAEAADVFEQFLKDYEEQQSEPERSSGPFPRS